METIDFLCNNLSTIDLKMFLISVQEQLDELFLETVGPNIIHINIGGLQVRILID
jgi:hypothetical protein